MMTTSELPKERDVAYCVHLHLETTTFAEPHLYKADHAVYKVEGKTRPMLVLGELSKRKRGKRWFHVIPITSKGKAEDGRRKPNCYSIGQLPGCETESYLVVDDVRLLPDNMVHQHNGKPKIVHQLDRLEFMNFVKITEHHQMRRKTTE
jgi:hypothetical protein